MTTRRVLIVGLTVLLAIAIQSSIKLGSWQSSQTEPAADGAVTISTRNGSPSYLLPDGWKLDAERSTVTASVYVPSDATDANYADVDALVVEHGTSTYASAGNPSGFCTYVTRTLRAKAHDVGYELAGGVSVTGAGLPLLNFSFEREGSPTLYFYYLVGNGEYVRIEGLAQTDGPQVQEAVDSVAASFSWR